MMKDKRRADLFQDAYVDAYTEMKNEGAGALSSRQRQTQNIDSAKSKNLALIDELKRYMTGGLAGGEHDKILTKKQYGEMKYSDLHRRTQKEIWADKDELFQGKLAREYMDQFTVKHGMDIQRPDFLAEMRASGKDMSTYDSLIMENIRNDVRQQLKASEYMMGDTYVRDKMTDEDFSKMLNNLHEESNSIFAHDGYLKQAEIYEGDEAALSELKQREAMIQQSINDEMERLKEVKYGTKPDKSNIFKDVQKDGKKILDKFKGKK
jgi:hypothetical protein